MNQFDDGWIRVSRSLLNATHDLHPQSTDEPACRLSAWLDMIGLARWRPGAGLERGQFRGSVRYLAARWNWSPGRAHRFILYLVAEGRIAIGTQPGRKPSIVTICNYDKYQLLPDGAEYTTPTAVDTPTGTRTDTRTGTSKKEEEERTTKRDTHAVWLESFNRLRTRKLPRSRGLSMTPQFRRKMSARIDEGLSEQEGIRAITGAFSTKHHIESNWKYLTPELIFRSQGHVDRFRMEAPRQNGDSGVSITARYECSSCLESFQHTMTVEEQSYWDHLCPDCTEKPTAEVDTSALVKSLTGRM